MLSQVRLVHFLQGSAMTEGIDKAQLKETIQSFQITNEELRGSTSGPRAADPSGLGLCEENCAPLLAKTEAAIEASSAVGRGKKWFSRLFIFALGLFLVDVFFLSRGVFQDSHVFQFMLTAGLTTAHLDQIHAKTETLLLHFQSLMEQLRSWIGVDLPSLYSDVVDATSPHLATLREYLHAGAVAVLRFATDVGEAALEMWALLATRLEEELQASGGFRGALVENVTLFYETTLENVRWAWAHASVHLAEVWAFVVAQWTLVKGALESNEAAMGLWLAAIEGWELLSALVTSLVTRGYAWCDQSWAELQSMV